MIERAQMVAQSYLQARSLDLIRYLFNCPVGFIKIVQTSKMPLKSKFCTTKLLSTCYRMLTQCPEVELAYHDFLSTVTLQRELK